MVNFLVESRFGDFMPDRAFYVRDFLLFRSHLSRLNIIIRKMSKQRLIHPKISVNLHGYLKV